MKFFSKSTYIFATGVLLGAGTLAIISAKLIDPNSSSISYSKDGRPEYKWHAPETPKEINFSGEKVPLERWEVKEKLDRELLINYYLHGSQLYILKLAGRYMPVIEDRLKANDIPEDFKYLCVAESSLQQNALSGAGAASFWQFMKDTGPRYGLEINDEVDERFHIVKATDAACKYFKEAYAKFGSWTAAAASYNCGMAGYSGQAEFQGEKNYYDLIFPDETNRYVYRILALKCLLSNPAKYGNILEPQEVYTPLKGKTIEVDKTIPDLAIWAKENKSSYRMLKIYNPWLRAHKLTVKPGKKYIITLPE